MTAAPIASVADVRASHPLPFSVDWPGWQQWLSDQLDPHWRQGEWNAQQWLFTGDFANPRTTVWKCLTPACPSGLYGRRSRCAPCTRDHHASGQSWDEFDASFVPERGQRRGDDPEDCAVTRDGQRCGRTALSNGVCLTHLQLWRDVYRPKGWDSAIDWGRQGGATPFPVPPSCSVGACDNKALHERTPLCIFHLRRWKKASGLGNTATREMLAWSASQPPFLSSHRFSLIELPPLLRLEIAYALQHRDELGHNLDPRSVRQIVAGLVIRDTSLVLRDDHLDGLYEKQLSPHAVFRQLAWSVRRGFVAFSGDDPWADDTIDLRAAGLKSRTRTGRRKQAGAADLTGIPQGWLRQLLRRWTEAERPTSNEFNRWHRGTVLAAQGMNRLPGGGAELSELDFTHIQAAFEEIAAARNSRTGKLCATSYRTKMLRDFFALLDFGRLTGQLEEAPGMFARHSSHRIPQEDTNEDEIGRAIPEHVIRQLDAQLDSFPVDAHYGGLDPEEVRAMFRAVYVVLRDCGRRPTEVASLPRNCLEREGDEVSLIWNNNKGRRMRRRLPIVTETVQTIERWQKIRDQVDAPSHSETHLFPAATDVAGLPHLSWITLGATLRKWVDSLPELDSGTFDTDGNPLPFDKSLIFPYAFRHSFAQRHADAGTPLDVLRDLMDHDDPRTTLGYYRVSLKRKREAVKTLSLQVVDRLGAASPCSPLAYEQRSVAVPFGGCTEPSNVKAGGQACPIRFQCSGCGFYRPDPSYLPTIEDHINSLRADRETALAMDAASFVVDNLTAQIVSYEEVTEKMRRRMASMPDEERAELEEAAAVLRRLRAGESRKLLPLTVIQQDTK